MRLAAILLFISFHSFSQNDSIRFKPKSNAEFFALPGLIYNHASLGYTLKTSERIEHNIELNGTFIIPDPTFFATYRGFYTMNFYNRKNNHFYLPFWVGFSRGILENSESERAANSFINYKVGTGYGAIIRRKQKDRFRIEAGIGAGLRTERESPHTFVISDVPILPMIRFNLKYIIPLYRK